jgi:hypothetical protein
MNAFCVRLLLQPEALTAVHRLMSAPIGNTFMFFTRLYPCGLARNCKTRYGGWEAASTDISLLHVSRPVLQQDLMSTCMSR